MLLLALRLRGRLAPAPFAALAVLLVCADLFRIGMGFNPAIDRTTPSVPKTPAIRYPRAPGNPARFVSTEEVAQNVIPFASASTRRAATTCRSCGATTASGAARCSPGSRLRGRRASLDIPLRCSGE